MSIPVPSVAVIDRDGFFSGIRSWLGSLNQTQVDGLNEMLPRIETDEPLTRITAWVAYLLATAYHETAHTWQPVAEYGKGRGRPYGRPVNGRVYYGRGYVQVTWLANYQRLTRESGVDVVTYPELAMRPDVAYVALSRGMREGWYTGKKLGDFIWVDPVRGVHADYLHARRIVNGMDRADLIAGYANAIEAVLNGTLRRAGAGELLVADTRPAVVRVRQALGAAG